MVKKIVDLKKVLYISSIVHTYNGSLSLTFIFNYSFGSCKAYLLIISATIVLKFLGLILLAAFSFSFSDFSAPMHGTAHSFPSILINSFGSWMEYWLINWQLDIVKVTPSYTSFCSLSFRLPCMKRVSLTRLYFHLAFQFLDRPYSHTFRIRCYWSYSVL